MATSKKTTPPEVDKITPPPLPINPKQLVSQCAETGAKVVHFAESYYRHIESATQRCGITKDGEPDGAWGPVADGDVPLKARSMLGMT
jgi:hypothetical protein